MRKRLVSGVALLFVPVILVEFGPAQTPRDLTGYLPVATSVVVDLVDGPALVERAFRLLAPLPGEIPPAARLVLAGLPLFTKALTGLDVNDLIGVLAPGQIAFALFPGEGRPFPVILSRIEDAAAARRVILRIAKKAAVRVDGDLLTVSDSHAHLAAVMRFRRSGAPTLLSDAAYRSGRAKMQPGECLRFYINLKQIRPSYGSQSLWDQMDDGARFFFGPVVRVLDLAGRIDGRLSVTDRGLVLKGEADSDLSRDPIGSARLTAVGTRGRPMPAIPEDTLACVALDRNLGELLGHPDRWLGEDGALGVKSFVGVADQFLATASLLTDLLPEIEMPMDFLVTASTAGDEDEEPRIKLPAFTLVFGVGDGGRKVKKLLDRAMTTIAAVISAQRVQRKQVPILSRPERRDGHRFQRIRFGDYRGPGDPPTEHGLSPTLLFAHGRGILSSTTDGALRVAETLKRAAGKQGEDKERITGDLVMLHGAAIAELIEKNFAPLTVDRVLKEGGSVADARTFLRALTGVVRALEAKGTVRPRAGATEFAFSLWRPAK